MNNNKDSLGDRMKLYEGLESDRRLCPLLPVMARMDGKCFHSFTRGLRRPYDQRFCMLMRQVTLDLVRETNAKVGYTQSDEISLAWYYTDVNTQLPFDGKIQKLTSWLAALTSVLFNRYMAIAFCGLPPKQQEQTPTFDARVWTVPNLTEATNCFLWREQDANRNSLQMAAQSEFSHNELQNKSCPELHEMLWKQRNINWDKYPDFFKRGSYVLARKTRRPFNAAELADLPANHAARTTPGLLVERTDVGFAALPPLGRICNREGVLFHDDIVRLSVTHGLEESAHVDVELVSELLPKDAVADQQG